jgi:hypothetical protein
MRRIDDEDYEIMKKWKILKYINFGRIIFDDSLNDDKLIWIYLSEQAWKDAHQERKEKFHRINNTPIRTKTIEKE